MNNKTKGKLSILFMCISFYMMITTKYMHALGDYLLEFIGLHSWTGDHSGFHLTIIYFGVLFVIGLLLVKQHAVDGLNMKRRDIFIVFIGVVTIFYFITGATVTTIKKNSSGLLAIGYNDPDGQFHYESRDYEFTDFEVELSLTNYSNEKKIFYLNIDSPAHRREGLEEISFYGLDGGRAIFELESKQTKHFIIDSDDYIMRGGRSHEHGSGSGTIQEVVLINDNGDKIRLDSKNLFGTEISR